MKMWVTLYVLLLTTGLPGPAVALPEEPNERADLSQRVKRAIKESTREGLVHHNLKGYFRLYDAKSIFVIGRQPTSDDHDMRQSYKQRKELLRRRWREKPVGHEALFFSPIKVRFHDDQIEAEFETTLHFFGGIKREKKRLTLRLKGDSLKVSHSRVWPTFETYGGATQYYTPYYWNEIDNEMFITLLSPRSDWLKIVQLSLKAHWHPLLLTYLRDLAKARPKDAEVWKALSAVAYLNGEFKLSIRARKRALRLNPEISIAPALK